MNTPLLSPKTTWRTPWRSLVHLSIYVGVWLLSGLAVSGLNAQLSYAESRVAVLDIKVAKQGGVSALDPFSARALTDDLRSLALSMGTYDVLTKENIDVLLPPDTSLEDCVGVCEVDVGRKIGAAYIITAEAGRIGGQIDLLIRLYSTESGTLLNQLNFTGTDAPSLRAQIKREGMKLFAKLATKDVAAGQLDTLLFFTLNPATARLSIDGKPVILSELRTEGSGYLLPVSPEVKHKVKVVADGYLTAHEEILISRGGVETLNIDLSKQISRAQQTCDFKTNPKCFGDLFVFTEPPGARLYVDGVLYKEPGVEQVELTESNNPETPNIGMLRLKLSPGTHIIEARIPRYKSVKREVTLSLGDFNRDMERSPMRLEANFGELIVETNPAQSVIELDAQMVAQSSPYRDTQMMVGAHKLKVMSPKYIAHERLIFVAQGKTERVEVQLMPAFSHLLISPRDIDGSAIQGARVELDQDIRSAQVVKGRGEVRFDEVMRGKHTLRITHPLYEPFSLALEVKPGGELLKLPINMKPRYAYLSLTAQGAVSATAFLGNGQELGALPLKRVRVPIGRHEVRVQPQHPQKYSPVDLSMTLKALEEKDFGHVVLKPRLGDLIINTKPYGAYVSVNGERKGKAPLKLKLLQGQHDITVSLKDYDSYTERAKVIEDETTELNINLGQNPSVKVTCSPAEAVVWVNGLPKGPSPQRYSARPGLWTLKCVLGSAEVSQRVKVRMGQTLTKHLEIATEQIAALRRRGVWMNRLGWGLLGTGAVGLLGGGVLWLGPQSSAVESRDQAYQGYLTSTPEELGARQLALREADASAVQWGQATVATTLTGAALSALGGLVLWLSPSVKASAPTPKAKPEQTPSKRERRKALERRQKSAVLKAKRVSP